MPSRKELLMRPALTVLAAAAALALLPSTAGAKKLVAARACDDDGCQAITVASKLRGMEEGTPAAAPERGAPFYRIRMTVRFAKRQTDTWTLVYVPSDGLVRVGGQFGGYEWLAATPRGQRGFDRLVRGLEPRPASELRGVGAEASEPVAQVDEVVPAPVADEDGGLPWTLLLIPGGLALAWTTWRVTKPHLRRTGAHGALARDDLS
jgi:hypothetical protein